MKTIARIEERSIMKTLGTCASRKPPVESGD
jgi:hypothetical protein